MTDSPCRRTSFTCSRIVSTASSALTLVKPVSSAMRLTISTFLMRPSRSHHADVAVIHTEWRKGVAHFPVASNNYLICISLTHLYRLPYAAEASLLDYVPFDHRQRFLPFVCSP